MLFCSFEFAIFLPIVFLLYWFVFGYALRKSRHQLMLQNMMIVGASYLFYGWWNWRFLLLIALTSFLSWGSGWMISHQRERGRLWLIINVALNLAIFGAFKYYDFFVGSLCELLGVDAQRHLLNVVLPVGISFYTFQALSYSIDVYRGRISAAQDIVAFFAYVSFFPQLVAGPIERASNLLPQFENSREFDYDEAVDGVRRILWGLFKKMVIADNCATYVDAVWSDYAAQSGSTLALAAALFAMQIYGDFSGYSDIAIGLARLFGIKLRDNFRTPYFSRNVAEFWKRWHISLNTWFVDYVYIPLGGSRSGLRKTLRNTFLIFLLSGLWHGANWTYIVWGMYHAVLFVPLLLLGRTKRYGDAVSWRQLPHILLTFMLVSLGWVVFRAQNLCDAWIYTAHMLSDICSVPSFPPFSMALTIAMMIAVEWLHRGKRHGLDLADYPKWLRLVVCYAVLFVLLLCAGQSEQFIYFQF